MISKGRAVSDFYVATICQLLFERFDKIRFASVENGASWAPDLLHRLSDAANRNPGYFKTHPVDVFAERVSVTPFWEDDISTLVADVSIDRLLFGSDWPHAEGVEAPEDFVTESLAWADDVTTKRIARDNALELLGVHVP